MISIIYNHLNYKPALDNIYNELLNSYRLIQLLKIIIKLLVKPKAKISSLRRLCVRKLMKTKPKKDEEIFLRIMVI